MKIALWVPMQITKTVSVKIPAAIWRLVKLYCVTNEITVQKFTLDCIYNFLKTVKEKEGKHEKMGT